MSDRLKILLTLVLVFGILVLGALSYVAIQRDFAAAGAPCVLASKNSRVNVTESVPVLAPSYGQNCAPSKIAAFVPVFWTYTLFALVLIGFLPRIGRSGTVPLSRRLKSVGKP